MLRLLVGVMIMSGLLIFGERADALSEEQPFEINRETREVLALGWSQAHRFNTDISYNNNLPRYHAIVSKTSTEFQVPVFVMFGSSEEFYRAMLDLDASPGEPFVTSTRKGVQGGNPFSDVRATGSAVEIFVSWLGAEKRYRLDEVMEDPGQRGIYMHFAGNKATMHTGCFVCLYSCDGGRVSNARYSYDDYTDGTTQFAAREDILPKDGTPVTITFKLKD